VKLLAMEFTRGYDFPRIICSPNITIQVVPLLSALMKEKIG
jgi:hypothetical protein